jgi:hypothetical protein
LAAFRVAQQWPPLFGGKYQMDDKVGKGLGHLSNGIIILRDEFKG